MVYIDAQGNIVNSRPEPQAQSRRPHNNIFRDEVPSERQQQQQRQGDAIPQWMAPGTTLGNINEQVKQYIPPINVMSVTVHPVMTVIAIILFAIFGIRALLVVAVAFLLMRQQARTPPAQQAPKHPRPARPGSSPR
eukprot:m.64688 g.64688  ORF g.64688 m.64688 type:complete len:136 (+) comp12023_c0_seq1:1917-2324(+)